MELNLHENGKRYWWERNAHLNRYYCRYLGMEWMIEKYPWISSIVRRVVIELNMRKERYWTVSDVFDVSYLRDPFGNARSIALRVVECNRLFPSRFRSVMNWPFVSKWVEELWVSSVPLGLISFVCFPWFSTKSVSWNAWSMPNAWVEKAKRRRYVCEVNVDAGDFIRAKKGERTKKKEGERTSVIGRFRSFLCHSLSPPSLLLWETSNTFTGWLTYACMRWSFSFQMIDLRSGQRGSSFSWHKLFDFLPFSEDDGIVERKKENIFFAFSHAWKYVQVHRFDLTSFQVMIRRRQHWGTADAL